MFMYINDIPFFSKGSGGSAGLSEQDKQNIIEIADKISADKIKQLLEHNIVALEIPDGTTTISNYQFQNNTDLRKVFAPESLETIGDNAFSGCFRMTGIDGLKGVKEIGTGAFENCYSLTDIEFPETLETINGSAFKNCCSLSNKDLILPNCKTIQMSAFQGCRFTGKLDLRKCTKIELDAFQGSNFSSIVFSSSLTSCDGSYRNPLSFTSLEFVDLGTNFNCNNFSLTSSTLYSIDTLVGVLNSLKDRTGETAYTFMLGATNLAKLTDEQKAIATNKNWILK